MVFRSKYPPRPFNRSADNSSGIFAKQLAIPLPGGQKGPSKPPVKTVILRGDLPGNIRVSWGSVLIEGSLHGNITSMGIRDPLDLGDIEIGFGEELIVKGDVYGNIMAEDSDIHIKGDVFGLAGHLIQNVNILVEGNITPHPQKTEEVPEKPPSLNRKRGKIQVVTLVYTSIEGDYGYYLIDYRHTFRKLIKGMEGNPVKPTKEEIAHFLDDVAAAAKDSREVARFVAGNPQMMDAA